MDVERHVEAEPGVDDVGDDEQHDRPAQEHVLGEHEPPARDDDGPSEDGRIRNHGPSSAGGGPARPCWVFSQWLGRRTSSISPRHAAIDMRSQ